MRRSGKTEDSRTEERILKIFREVNWVKPEDSVALAKKYRMISAKDFRRPHEFLQEGKFFLPDGQLDINVIKSLKVSSEKFKELQYLAQIEIPQAQFILAVFFVTQALNEQNHDIQTELGGLLFRRIFEKSADLEMVHSANKWIAELTNLEAKKKMKRSASEIADRVHEIAYGWNEKSDPKIKKVSKELIQDVNSVKLEINPYQWSAILVFDTSGHRMISLIDFVIAKGKPDLAKQLLSYDPTCKMIDGIPLSDTSEIGKWISDHSKNQMTIFESFKENPTLKMQFTLLALNGYSDAQYALSRYYALSVYTDKKDETSEELLLYWTETSAIQGNEEAQKNILRYLKEKTHDYNPKFTQKAIVIKSILKNPNLKNTAEKYLESDPDILTKKLIDVEREHSKIFEDLKDLFASTHIDIDLSGEMMLWTVRETFPKEAEKYVSLCSKYQKLIGLKTSAALFLPHLVNIYNPQIKEEVQYAVKLFDQVNEDLNKESKKRLILIKKILLRLPELELKLVSKIHRNNFDYNRNKYVNLISTEIDSYKLLDDFEWIVKKAAAVVQYTKAIEAEDKLLSQLKVDELAAVQKEFENLHDECSKLFDSSMVQGVSNVDALLIKLKSHKALLEEYEKKRSELNEANRIKPAIAELRLFFTDTKEHLIAINDENGVIKQTVLTQFQLDPNFMESNVIALAKCLLISEGEMRSIIKNNDQDQLKEILAKRDNKKIIEFQDQVKKAKEDYESSHKSKLAKIFEIYLKKLHSLTKTYESFPKDLKTSIINEIHNFKNNLIDLGIINKNKSDKDQDLIPVKFSEEQLKGRNVKDLEDLVQVQFELAKKIDSEIEQAKNKIAQWRIDTIEVVKKRLVEIKDSDIFLKKYGEFFKNDLKLVNEKIHTFGKIVNQSVKNYPPTIPTIPENISNDDLQSSLQILNEISGLTKFSRNDTDKTIIFLIFNKLHLLKLKITESKELEDKIVSSLGKLKIDIKKPAGIIENISKLNTNDLPILFKELDSLNDAFDNKIQVSKQASTKIIQLLNEQLAISLLYLDLKNVTKYEQINFEELLKQRKQEKKSNEKEDEYFFEDEILKLMDLDEKYNSAFTIDSFHIECKITQSDEGLRISAFKLTKNVDLDQLAQTMEIAIQNLENNYQSLKDQTENIILNALQMLPMMSDLKKSIQPLESAKQFPKIRTAAESFIEQITKLNKSNGEIVASTNVALIYSHYKSLKNLQNTISTFLDNDVKKEEQLRAQHQEQRKRQEIENEKQKQLAEEQKKRKQEDKERIENAARAEKLKLAKETANSTLAKILIIVQKLEILKDEGKDFSRYSTTAENLSKKLESSTLESFDAINSDINKFLESISNLCSDVLALAYSKLEKENNDKLMETTTSASQIGADIKNNSNITVARSKLSDALHVEVDKKGYFGKKSKAKIHRLEILRDNDCTIDDFKCHWKLITEAYSAANKIFLDEKNAYQEQKSKEEQERKDRQIREEKERIDRQARAEQEELMRKEEERRRVVSDITNMKGSIPRSKLDSSISKMYDETRATSLAKEIDDFSFDDEQTIVYLQGKLSEIKTLQKNVDGFIQQVNQYSDRLEALRKEITDKETAFNQAKRKFNVFVKRTEALELNIENIKDEETHNNALELELSKLGILNETQLKELSERITDRTSTLNIKSSELNNKIRSAVQLRISSDLENYNNKLTELNNLVGEHQTISQPCQTIMSILAKHLALTLQDSHKKKIDLNFVTNKVTEADADKIENYLLNLQEHLKSAILSLEQEIILQKSRAEEEAERQEQQKYIKALTAYVNECRVLEGLGESKEILTPLSEDYTHFKNLPQNMLNEYPDASNRSTKILFLKDNIKKLEQKTENVKSFSNIKSYTLLADALAQNQEQLDRVVSSKLGDASLSGIPTTESLKKNLVKKGDDLTQLKVREAYVKEYLSRVNTQIIAKIDEAIDRERRKVDAQNIAFKELEKDLPEHDNKTQPIKNRFTEHEQNCKQRPVSLTAAQTLLETINNLSKDAGQVIIHAPTKPKGGTSPTPPLVGIKEDTVETAPTTVHSEGTKNDSKEKTTLPKPTSVATQSDSKEKTTLPKPTSVATQSDSKEKTTLTKPTSVATQSDSKGETTLTKPTSAATQSDSKGETTLTKPTSVATQSDSKEQITLPKPTSVATPSNSKEPITLSKPTSVATQSASKGKTTLTKPTSVATQSASKGKTTLTKSTSVATQSDSKGETTLTKPTPVATQSDSKEKTTLTKPTPVATQNNSKEKTTLTKPTSVATQSDSKGKTTLTKPTSVATPSDSKEKTTLTKPTSVATQSASKDPVSPAAPKGTSVKGPQKKPAVLNGQNPNISSTAVVNGTLVPCVTSPVKDDGEVHSSKEDIKEALIEAPVEFSGEADYLYKTFITPAAGQISALQSRFPSNPELKTLQNSFASCPKRSVKDMIQHYDNILNNDNFSKQELGPFEAFTLTVTVIVKKIFRLEGYENDKKRLEDHKLSKEVKTIVSSLNANLKSQAKNAKVVEPPKTPTKPSVKKSETTKESERKQTSTKTKQITTRSAQERKEPQKTKQEEERKQEEQRRKEEERKQEEQRKQEEERKKEEQRKKEEIKRKLDEEKRKAPGFFEKSMGTHNIREKLRSDVVLLRAEIDTLRKTVRQKKQDIAITWENCALKEGTFGSKLLEPDKLTLLNNEIGNPLMVIDAQLADLLLKMSLYENGLKVLDFVSLDKRAKELQAYYSEYLICFEKASVLMNTFDRSQKGEHTFKTLPGKIKSA